jgi:hypothetical protein
VAALQVKLQTPGTKYYRSKHMIEDFKHREKPWVRYFEPLEHSKEGIFVGTFREHMHAWGRYILRKDVKGSFAVTSG